MDYRNTRAYKPSFLDNFLIRKMVGLQIKVYKMEHTFGIRSKYYSITILQNNIFY